MLFEKHRFKKNTVVCPYECFLVDLDVPSRTIKILGRVMGEEQPSRENARGGSSSYSGIKVEINTL